MEYVYGYSQVIQIVLPAILSPGTLIGDKGREQTLKMVKKMLADHPYERAHVAHYLMVNIDAIIKKLRLVQADIKHAAT